MILAFNPHLPQQPATSPSHRLADDHTNQTLTISPSACPSRLAVLLLFISDYHSLYNTFIHESNSDTNHHSRSGGQTTGGKDVSIHYRKPPRCDAVWICKEASPPPPIYSNIHTTQPPQHPHVVFWSADRIGHMAACGTSVALTTQP